MKTLFEHIGFNIKACSGDDLQGILFYLKHCKDNLERLGRNEQLKGIEDEIEMIMEEIKDRYGDCEEMDK